MQQTNVLEVHIYQLFILNFFFKNLYNILTDIQHHMHILNAVNEIGMNIILGLTHLFFFGLPFFTVDCGCQKNDKEEVIQPHSTILL